MPSFLGGASVDRLALALVTTVLIEVPIVVGIMTLKAPSVGVMISASTAFFANLITHPLGIWVTLPLLTRVTGAGPALVLVEAVVVIVEAAIYTRRFRDGVLGAGLSGIANLASFGLGALLFARLPFV